MKIFSVHNLLPILFLSIFLPSCNPPAPKTAGDMQPGEVILTARDTVPGSGAIDRTTMKGIGLVRIAFGKTMTVNFYPAPGAAVPERKIELVPDPENKGLFCVKLLGYNTGRWFLPFEFDPGRQRFTFQCADSTESAYQVILDEKTGHRAWLQKAPGISFIVRPGS